MSSSIAILLNSLFKLGAVALVLNEVRGLVLAGPVIYGIYQAGGTLVAIWLGISSLGGIALSVVLPVYASRKLKKRIERHLPEKPQLA